MPKKFEVSQGQPYLDSDTILDNNTRSQDNIWPDSTALADFDAWIGQDITLNTFSG